MEICSSLLQLFIEGDGIDWPLELLPRLLHILADMKLHKCMSVAFIVSLALFVVNGSAGPILNDIDDYSVPVFTIRELQEGSRRKELEAILTTTGLISVVGSENDMLTFHSMRSKTFSGLCTCMQPGNSHFASVEGVDSSLLSDETTRITLATATVGSTPLPLHIAELEDAGCNSDAVHAMEALRDYVAFSSDVFVQELDRLVAAGNRVQEPILESSNGSRFMSVSSIVKGAHNLEHFHMYRKSHGASDHYDLDFHTDAGLFLTFVPGMQCDMDETSPDDFYIQDMNGIMRRALFPENSVGIMLGVGAEHWLRTDISLRATSHAVALSPGQNRAWYGMSK
jgi:hypothetical protein